MPLWKQKQFTRLMRPTDGDGSDLGGGGEQTSQSIPDDQDSGTLVTESTDNADSPSQATDETASDESGESTKPGSKMAAMLDALTDDPNAAKTAPEATESKPDQEKSAAPADQAEEAELLDGVKSDRGRERIKQVFAERKQLQQDITDFRELVKSTGMAPDEFAKTLEFGRLVNSGDEKNIRVAIEMIEEQRVALYQKLGVEAPGIDLLRGHDDLKTSVENMEITRDKALELAKYRQQQAAVQAKNQTEQQIITEREQYQAQVQTASTTMEAYLGARSKEVDHPARMKIISERFSDPTFMQQFVATYRPEQWAATVKMMYDNIQVPRAPQHDARPISARSATLGTPSTTAQTPLDRLAQRMDSMGI